MDFLYADLSDCTSIRGLVVAIDVLRAFTTAAFAFARGAEKIYPASSNEDAFLFKKRYAGSLISGENHGLPPAGFDLGNSPTQIMKHDLTGCCIVQRTSAGTPGLTYSINASTRLAASFVVAAATVRYIQSLKPPAVTFLITGKIYDSGDEDQACAEYLEACLKESKPDPEPYLERVRRCQDAKPFFDPKRPEFPESDIMYCTNIDRFSFAMCVQEEDGVLVLRPVLV